MCALLGIKSPEHLRRELTSRQIERWFAYYRFEPWGEQSAYWRAALVASVLANIYRKSGAQPATIADFMPRMGRVREQSPEKLMAAFSAIAAAVGPGKVGERYAAAAAKTVVDVVVESLPRAPRRARRRMRRIAG